MKLILISGWKGSGKDLAASHLVEKHGFIQLSFAAALKDIVSVTYGIPRNWFDDREMKERPLLDFPVASLDKFSETLNNYMSGEHKTLSAEQIEQLARRSTDKAIRVGAKQYHTPRSLCILEGSVKRSVDANFWVKLAVARCEPNKKYVISDCRYRSEVAAVKLIQPSVRVYRVDRFDSTTSTDPSERDLDIYCFDQIISNRSSKEEFLLKLDALFNIT